MEVIVGIPVSSVCGLFQKFTAAFSCFTVIMRTKGYATRERFLQRILQNPPNLRKILSRDGVFNEIVIAQHAC